MLPSQHILEASICHVSSTPLQLSILHALARSGAGLHPNSSFLRPVTFQSISPVALSPSRGLPDLLHRRVLVDVPDPAKHYLEGWIGGVA